MAKAQLIYFHSSGDGIIPSCLTCRLSVILLLRRPVLIVTSGLILLYNLPLGLLCLYYEFVQCLSKNAPITSSVLTQHRLQPILSWDGFLHIDYPLQCLVPWSHHLIDDFYLRGHSYNLNQDLVVECVDSVVDLDPRSAAVNNVDHRGKATAIDAASTFPSVRTASSVNTRGAGSIPACAFKGTI